MPSGAMAVVLGDLMVALERCMIQFLSTLMVSSSWSQEGLCCNVL